MGLRTWKKQLKGTDQYQIAKSLIFLVNEIDKNIKEIRLRFQLREETDQPLKTVEYTDELRTLEKTLSIAKAELEKELFLLGLSIKNISQKFNGLSARIDKIITSANTFFPISTALVKFPMINLTTHMNSC
ncbi:hypothetical protein [Legionella tunisiensis]|uniref:hypothetical protein n=1 Tax=Legionella tunisiensis TaxID=1034944 RepID=UPI000300456E|nr:hypothetical protein [Legionella tunisiensis]